MSQWTHEAALLFLHGVKRGFLFLQIGDQLFGPINSQLIAYREQYSLIPLNRFVDFDALIAHRTPLEPRNGATTLMVA
jgi:hypothetical protein